MESEQHHYDLRSRSRSRSHTPMVQNFAARESESVEHHYDLRNKSRERSHTPGEVTSSRRSGSRSLTNSATKIHDHSMETIVEKREEIATYNQNKSSDSLASANTKKPERRSERQRVKKQIFANGQGESSGEDILNAKDEEKRKSVTPARILTSDYSSEEGESQDVSSKAGSAYEIYKQAGEWWNVFPKTDYTYSEKSQCRYEIAPGVLAMPNMSRCSIHSNVNKSVNVTYSSSQNLSRSSQETVDSGFTDFMDDKVRENKEDKASRPITRWLQSLIFIASGFYSKILKFLNMERIAASSYSYNYSYSYRRFQAESRWSKLWKFTRRFVDYIYLLLVGVLHLDTWLLSRFSPYQGRIENRGYKLILIALLPILLLSGCWSFAYLSQLFPSVGRMTTESHSVSAPIVSSSIHGTGTGTGRRRWHEDSAVYDELRLSIEKLSSRIAKVEEEFPKVERERESTEHPFSLTDVLEAVKEKDVSVRKKYDDKLSGFEWELGEMKREFRRLQELYTEVKSTAVSKTEFTSIIENTISCRDNEDREEVLEDEVESDDRIRRIVREMLKIYDADKTGQIDYALESAGGQIVSTRCTQMYNIRSRVIKFLGFTLYYDNNDPRRVIQGHPIQPGLCWAFQDFPGYLLIKLRNLIYVTGFTVEHVPRCLLPNGEMKSAPRKFNVWGLIDENDPEPVIFGDYEFRNSDDNLQYFPVQNTSITSPYEYVELRVNSNHGQFEYTCLYRFRVHGRPA